MLLPLLLTKDAFSLSVCSTSELLLQIVRSLHQSLSCPNLQRNATRDHTLEAFYKKMSDEKTKRVKKLGMVGYLLSSASSQTLVAQDGRGVGK